MLTRCGRSAQAGREAARQLAPEGVPAAPCAPRPRPRSTAASRGLLADGEVEVPEPSVAGSPRRPRGGTARPRRRPGGTPAGRPGCSRAPSRRAAARPHRCATAAPSRAAVANPSSGIVGGRGEEVDVEPAELARARAHDPPARGLARAAARRGRRRAPAGRRAASPAAARARRVRYGKRSCSQTFWSPPSTISAA